MALCNHQPDQSDPASREGLVIGHRGKGILVETADHTVLLCQTRRRLGALVVGDRVIWKPESGDSGVIEKILDRHSVLLRPGHGNKKRLYSANVDAMFIVSAVVPEPDFLLIDQCIVMCETNQITAHLVINKIDKLAETDDHTHFMQTFSLYQTIGYQLHQTCVPSRLGISQLQTAFKDGINILTGQSGVGKSSLTALLLPQREIRIGNLSQSSQHGKHTTTSATLYHLPNGGDLIDSPGLSVFGLADISQQQLAWGYKEFRPHIENCRFNDCRHHQDKGCHVQQAVKDGKINPDRYQRYLKLSDRLRHSSTTP